MTVALTAAVGVWFIAVFVLWGLALAADRIYGPAPDDERPDDATPEESD